MGKRVQRIRKAMNSDWRRLYFKGTSEEIAARSLHKYTLVLHYYWTRNGKYYMGTATRHHEKHVLIEQGRKYKRNKQYREVHLYSVLTEIFNTI